MLRLDYIYPLRAEDELCPLARFWVYNILT